MVLPQRPGREPWLTCPVCESRTFRDLFYNYVFTK
jgi:hypothetical protein